MYGVDDHRSGLTRAVLFRGVKMEPAVFKRQVASGKHNLKGQVATVGDLHSQVDLVQFTTANLQAGDGAGGALTDLVQPRATGSRRWSIARKASCSLGSIFLKTDTRRERPNKAKQSKVLRPTDRC